MSIKNPRLEHALRRHKPSTFLYCVRCNEFIKIGITSDVSGRITLLQIGNPYKLRLLASWAVEDAIVQEERLHGILGRWYERGEWFKAPDDVVRKLVECKSLDDFMLPLD